MSAATASGATTVGVVIRYKDHAGPLASCLAGLAAQTRQPDAIVAIDTGSGDASGALVRAAGARVLTWSHPYHPSQVLNAGVAACDTDLVLVLSAHVAMRDPTTVARMVAALAADDVAGVSARWEGQPWRDRVTAADLRREGLRIGSFYSNAIGMIRRQRWLERPFDERIDWIEDYAWAVETALAGWSFAILDVPTRYSRVRPRPGHRSDFARHHETQRLVRALARHHGLPLVWLGLPGTTVRCLAAAARAMATFGRDPSATEEARLHAARLTGWFAARWSDPYAAGARRPVALPSGARAA